MIPSSPHPLRPPHPTSYPTSPTHWLNVANEKGRQGRAPTQVLLVHLMQAEELELGGDGVCVDRKSGVTGGEGAHNGAGQRGRRGHTHAPEHMESGVGQRGPHVPVSHSFSLVGGRGSHHCSEGGGEEGCSYLEGILPLQGGGGEKGVLTWGDLTTAWRGENGVFIVWEGISVRD